MSRHETKYGGIRYRARALELPQSNKGELDRRLAARDADLHSGSSWEDVKTRLQK